MTNWKKGDKCRIITCNSEDCEILYIDKMSIVFSSSSTPMYIGDVTPAEVEKKRVLKLAENANRDARKGCYSSVLKDFAEVLYDAGLLSDPGISFDAAIDLMIKLRGVVKL